MTGDDNDDADGSGVVVRVVHGGVSDMDEDGSAADPTSAAPPADVDSAGFVDALEVQPGTHDRNGDDDDGDDAGGSGGSRSEGGGSISGGASGGGAGGATATISSRRTSDDDAWLGFFDDRDVAYAPDVYDPNEIFSVLDAEAPDAAGAPDAPLVVQRPQRLAELLLDLARPELTARMVEFMLEDGTRECRHTGP
jgi:hypothetical protein